MYTLLICLNRSEVDFRKVSTVAVKSAAFPCLRQEQQRSVLPPFPCLDRLMESKWILVLFLHGSFPVSVCNVSVTPRASFPHTSASIGDLIASFRVFLAEAVPDFLVV